MPVKKKVKASSDVFYIKEIRRYFTYNSNVMKISNNEKVIWFLRLQKICRSVDKTLTKLPDFQAFVGKNKFLSTCADFYALPTQLKDVKLRVTLSKQEGVPLWVNLL